MFFKRTEAKQTVKHPSGKKQDPNFTRFDEVDEIFFFFNWMFCFG